MRIYIPLLLILFFSCRKKENAAPVIAITSPVQGEIFTPGDTVHIEADITDNDEIASITLKLLNAAYSPVDHQESIPINASSSRITFEYIIENIYLVTGNYYITLSVSDGDNYVNEFRRIVIHEIPRTRKAVYLLTQADSSNIKISLIDSVNQSVHQFNVPGDYSGSAISSRYNQLYVAGKTTGGISTYNLGSNSLLQAVPPYNGMLPSFNNLFFYNELSFISYYDGRIKAYNKDGNTQFNSAKPVYYRPGALYANDKYVFAEAYYPGPDETRLTVINFPSGIARQEFNGGFDIVSMESISDDELIVFANKNGDGKIYLYHVISNGANDFHTLFNNTVYCAKAIDNDRYAIATSNGLYSYQESNNNLIPVDLSEPVYSLEFDAVNGVLFANFGRRIKAYAFPDPGVLYTINSADSVLDVRILYNK